MSGTLRAEQVRKTVEKHWHDLPAEYDMPEATALPEYSYDWQAIADELNATLGGGECEMVTSGTPCEGNTDKTCTLCGAYNIGEYYDGQGHIAAPKFCPECGRQVKAVKR